MSNFTLFNNIPPLQFIGGLTPTICLGLYGLLFYNIKDQTQIETGNPYDNKLETLASIFTIYQKKSFRSFCLHKGPVLCLMLAILNGAYLTIGNYNPIVFSIWPIIVPIVIAFAIRTGYQYLTICYPHGTNKLFNTFHQLVTTKKNSNTEEIDYYNLLGHSLLLVGSFTWIIHAIYSLSYMGLNALIVVSWKAFGFQLDHILLDFYHTLFMVNSIAVILYMMYEGSLLSKLADVCGDTIAFKTQQKEDETGSVFDKLDSFGDYVSDDFKGILMICLANIISMAGFRMCTNVSNRHFYIQQLFHIFGMGYHKDPVVGWLKISFLKFTNQIITPFTLLVFSYLIKRFYVTTFFPFVSKYISFNTINELFNKYIMGRTNFVWQYYLTGKNEKKSTLIDKAFFCGLAAGLYRLIGHLLFDVLKIEHFASRIGYGIVFSYMFLGLISETFYQISFLITSYYNGSGQSLKLHGITAFDREVGHFINQDDSISVLNNDVYKVTAGIKNITFIMMLIGIYSYMVPMVSLVGLIVQHIIFTEVYASKYDIIDSIVKTEQSYQNDMEGNTIKYHNKIVCCALIWQYLRTAAFDICALGYTKIAVVFDWDIAKEQMTLLLDTLLNVFAHTAAIAKIGVLFTIATYWIMTHAWGFIPKLVQQLISQINTKNSNDSEREELLDDVQTVHNFFNLILSGNIYDSVMQTLLPIVLTPLLCLTMCQKLALIEDQVQLAEKLGSYFTQEILSMDLILFSISCLCLTFNIFTILPYVTKGSLSDNFKKVVKWKKGGVSGSKIAYALAQDRMGDLEKDTIGNIFHLSTFSFLLYMINHPWHGILQHLT